MRKVLAAAAIIAAVGGTATAVSAGNDNSRGNGGRPLSTTLTPETEVAPFEGVEGASGEVSLRLNPGRQQICLDLTTENFDLTLAHIHEAPVGENGDVVVDFEKQINDDGTTASGCVSAERSLILEILKDPTDYYVNVHQVNALQAIRGQLGR